ncbi:MAG: thioredoxin family protein [Pseudomonadales bacterium]
MANKRHIEIFSAGCSVCQETVDLVHSIACPSCEVSVLDMQDSAVTKRARTLGVQSLPAVVIDGQLADCCAGRGVDEDTLRRAGVGRPLP